MPSPAQIVSEPIVDVYARGIDLIARLRRDCCGTKERADGLAAARTTLVSALERTLALGASEALGEEGAEAIGAALGIARETFEKLLEPLGEDEPITAVPIDGFISLTGYFATNRLPGLPPDPGPEIDPNAAREFVKRIIELLEALRDALARANGRSAELRREVQEWLDFFKQLLAYLTSGGAVARRYILQVLSDFTMFLYRSFGQIGRQLGRRFLFPILSAIWSFLQSIGVAFGAEAGTAAAGAAGLGVIAACLVALGAGVLIGKWIGRIEIKGKSVVDWIADGMYWIVSDNCDELYDAYIELRNLRRSYEKSGPTLDKSVMIPLLVNEASALRRYLDKPCPDDGHVLAKEFARLQQRVAVFGVVLP